MKRFKRFILWIAIVCQLLLPGCKLSSDSEETGQSISDSADISSAPEKLDAYSFVCENGTIAYQSLTPGASRLMVHGGYVNPNAFNYTIRVTGSGYIFCYMSEEDGQLSHGETISCGEGLALTDDVTKLYFGNHAVFYQEGVLGVMPSVGENGGEGEEKESVLYLYSYANNPIENADEKPTERYRVVFKVSEDSSNDHVSNHSHEYEITLQESDRDLSDLFQ